MRVEGKKFPTTQTQCTAELVMLKLARLVMPELVPSDRSLSSRMITNAMKMRLITSKKNKVVIYQTSVIDRQIYLQIKIVPRVLLRLQMVLMLLQIYVFQM